MRSFCRNSVQRKVIFRLTRGSGMLEKWLILSMLISLLFIWDQSTAQPATITYTASNITLSKVFDDLSKKYRIKFAYDAEVFRKIKASFSFRNEPFSKITEYLGNRYSLEFRVMEGTWIVIQKKVNQSSPEIPQNPVPVSVAARSQVTGYVTDQVTGESLNYCSIIFPNNRGTITNELGFFYIETSSDSVSFYITHLGYQRLDTVISVEESQPFRILLKPFITVMQEVNVFRKETNMLEMPKYADRVAFNSSQSANMPRLANDDLINMLTLIPGISFLPGSTGGLSIRGSNPSENLVILDGIPLLETGHLFGNVSVLNAGFIRQAFVSRGGFDVQYGDKASGLIELTGKSGSRYSPSLETSFNLLNGDILASVPLGKKFSVSGAYRRSYMDYWPNYLFKKLLGESRLTNMADQTVSVLPIVKYQDINMKATVYASDNSEIVLSLIRSDDQQMLDYMKETKPLLYRNEWVREKNTGFGLTWFFQTGNWHHYLTSGYSELHHYQEQESGEEIPVSTTDHDHENDNDHHWNSNKIKKENPNRIKYELDTDSNSVHEFRIQNSTEVKHGIFTYGFGAGYVENYFHFRLWSNNSERTVPIDSLKKSSKQRISNIFFQQNIEPVGQFKFRWGLRVNYDQLNGKFYLQPRGGIVYTPSQTMRVYYNAGIYNQFLSKVPLIDYSRNVDLVWYLPDNSGKGMLKSIHHIAGFQWNKGGFLVNAEYYNKSTSGKQWLYAESYKIRDHLHIRYVNYGGEELKQGIDIFAQFRHSHWNHQAGYSLAFDKERIEGINSGSWFPSLNNHRHQLQLTEMFSMKGWVASAIWNFRSGKPRILPSTSSTTLSFERFDYFSQLDACLAKTFLFRHVGLTTGVSLLNILNRLNVVQVDYLHISSMANTYNITSKVSSLSFTPVFFLKFRFF
jgi:ferric enterobactin receptor